MDKYTEKKQRNKVFKKLIGVTPGSYRKYNKVMPVDKLFID